jgi:PEP-CTERM motif
MAKVAMFLSAAAISFALHVSSALAIPITDTVVGGDREWAQPSLFTGVSRRSLVTDPKNGAWFYHYVQPVPPGAPEPGTFVLLGSALMGLFAVRRKHGSATKSVPH